MIPFMANFKKNFYHLTNEIHLSFADFCVYLTLYCYVLFYSAVSKYFNGFLSLYFVWALGAIYYVCCEVKEKKDFCTANCMERISQAEFMDG